MVSLATWTQFLYHWKKKPLNNKWVSHNIIKKLMLFIHPRRVINIFS